MKSQSVINSDVNYPIWLNNFLEVYQKLSVDNLDLLKTIYSEEVCFKDPIHQIEGFENLYQYFQNLYQNVVSCSFIIDEVLVDGDKASLSWTMIYRHPKLNKNQVIKVFGNSLIKGKDEQVYYHRDYLDLGEMIYEHIPFFGKLVKYLKKKVA